MHLLFCEACRPKRANFQFPLLGFLLCIALLSNAAAAPAAALSIPFIGIFALHLQVKDLDVNAIVVPFQFPLLGFLLCIELFSVADCNARFTFNSLYWDFCFASWFLGCRDSFGGYLSIPFIGIFALHRDVVSVKTSAKHDSFNSLYWDFCFASTS